MTYVISITIGRFNGLMRWCWREGDGFSRFVFFRGRILPNLKCGGFINNQHEDLDRVGYISCINGGSLLMISTLWPSTGISPSWSCDRSKKFIGTVEHREKRPLDCSRWCRNKRPVMLLLLSCCFISRQLMNSFYAWRTLLTMADKLFAKLPDSRWPEKLDVLFAAKLSLRFLDCMQYKSPVRRNGGMTSLLCW